MKYLLPLLLVLAGCAHTDPEPIVRTVTVKVPVPVKCVPEDLAGPPAYADTDAALRAAAGADQRYQLLAVGRSQRIIRLRELETVLAGCR